MQPRISGSAGVWSVCGKYDNLAKIGVTSWSVSSMDGPFRIQPTVHYYYMYSWIPTDCSENAKLLSINQSINQSINRLTDRACACVRARVCVCTCVSMHCNSTCVVRAGILKLTQHTRCNSWDVMWACNKQNSFLKLQIRSLGFPTINHQFSAGNHGTKNAINFQVRIT